MSMFRLINKTGEDQTVEWLDNFVFPQNIEIDLLDAGSYVSGEDTISYDFGLEIEDLLGIKNGQHFEQVRSLLLTNSWILSDGVKDLQLDISLSILNFGQLPEIKAKSIPNDNSGVSFNSHNLGDMEEWTDGKSDFEIVPAEGTTIHLTKAKVMLDKLFAAPEAVVFEVWMDYVHPQAGLMNIPVKTIPYDTIDDIKMGADTVMLGPSVGEGISERGSSETVHFVFLYEHPISLHSSLHMKLVVKFAENTPLEKKTLCRLRFEGQVETIV